MTAQRVAFTAQYQAELEEFELDAAPLQDKEILVRTRYSIISAGTEGAAFSGLEKEHPVQAAYPGAGEFSYPVYPGYGNIGEVLDVGAKVEKAQVGETVFTAAPHASLARFDTNHVCVHIPDGLELKKAVFGRMAGVAMTALRKADFSAGDKVLVIGLGLVGNFAAQEFLLAGGEVMAVDVSPARLEQARQCGITRVLNPQQDDLTQAVNDWTNGEGARVVVEAIGAPQLIAEGAQLASRHGDLILLGSPRKRVEMDVTPLLTCIHLKALNLKGALEWRYPIPESEFARHSVTGNMKQILGWLQQDKLKTEPLLTHVLPPTQCQQAYDGLHKKKDEYLGVVFDWS